MLSFPGSGSSGNVWTTLNEDLSQASHSCSCAPDLDMQWWSHLREAFCMLEVGIFKRPMKGIPRASSPLCFPLRSSPLRTKCPLNSTRQVIIPPKLNSSLWKLLLDFQTWDMWNRSRWGGNAGNSVDAVWTCPKALRCDLHFQCRMTDTTTGDPGTIGRKSPWHTVLEVSVNVRREIMPVTALYDVTLHYFLTLTLSQGHIPKKFLGTILGKYGDYKFIY